MLLQKKIWASLKKDGIVHDNKRPERFFHYSKSPFDQIRDALCFLYITPKRGAELSEISFAHYLLNRGVPPKEIEHLTMYPRVNIRNKTDKTDHEVSLWEEAKNYTFAQSYELLQRVTSQPFIDTRSDMSRQCNIHYDVMTSTA